MLARENPFRTEKVLAYRYQFSTGGSLQSVVEQFDAMGRRGALVGPKGHGKTTLAEDLSDLWNCRGISIRTIRLTSVDRAAAFEQCWHSLANAQPGSILVIDGAEQLGWFRWQRLRRFVPKQIGLLITTHKPGRLPTLFECCTSPELLLQTVTEIAPDVLDEVGSDPGLLFKEKAGNIRECLRSLYDRYAYQ